MIRTLKSYCNNKYDEYLKLNYKGSRRYLHFILIKSSTDPRLALVAQSYYFSKGDFVNAKKFSSVTNEKYNNTNEFLTSKNKYVVQFNKRLEANKLGKTSLKKMIEKIMIEEGLSYYQLNKRFGFSRSKLNDFFKYGKMNVFSVKKLVEINKTLNIAFKK